MHRDSITLPDLRVALKAHVLDPVLPADLVLSNTSFTSTRAAAS
jgi:hypothetical protein